MSCKWSKHPNFRAGLVGETDRERSDRFCAFRAFVIIFAGVWPTLEINGIGSCRFSQKTADFHRELLEAADSCRNWVLLLGALLEMGEEALLHEVWQNPNSKHLKPINCEGQFWAPWRYKPGNGLLRTLSGFQKVLRRPVRGFPCTGCTEMLLL